MQRDSSSHKGDNGKVAIIGGSLSMHGAPLFAALAAEKSGVDLLYVCLPRCHAEVAKNTSLNFQVHPFIKDAVSAKDVEPILELLATMDTVVIGPGVAKDPASITVLDDIIAGASCTMVLDATALQMNTLELIRGRRAVLTPHLGELERMNIPQSELPNIARETETTIVLKGEIDLITKLDGTKQEITGGNAGLTVGGTGDVLAGLIAGLIAQGHTQDQASVQACKIIKRAAEGLFENYGYAITAQHVLDQIPALVRSHD